eukprot:Rhum_TRINITY_DN14473_c6_g1::Rhum_TRINITY_DN14473_c6_g1_i1::g.93359::m.93359
MGRDDCGTCVRIRVVATELAENGSHRRRLVSLLLLFTLTLLLQSKGTGTLFGPLHLFKRPTEVRRRLCLCQHPLADAGQILCFNPGSALFLSPPAKRSTGQKKSVKSGRKWSFFFLFFLVVEQFSFYKYPPPPTPPPHTHTP